MPRFLAIAAVVLVTLGARAPASAQCLATHGSIVAMGCDDTTLAISRDDGASFVDTGLHVAHVTVTDDDRVLAVSDGEPPSLFDVGGSSRDALPLAHVDALVSVGRGVVVVGRLDASDPRAPPRTLVLVRPHDGPLRELARLEEHSSSLRVSVTGTERAPRVELVLAYGLSCWGTVQVRRAIVDARGTQIADLSNDVDCANEGQGCGGFFDVEIGAHGSAYAVRAPAQDGTERPGPLLLVRPTEQTRPTSLHVPSEATLSVAHNGRMTMALLDGVLHRLEGTRASRVGGRIDRDALLVYLDARGRPYAETTTGLFRFSRGGGWRPIRR